jgi:hypothetical protein
MKQGFAVQMKLSPLLTNDILRIKPVETHTNVNVAEQKTSHRKPEDKVVVSSVVLIYIPQQNVFSFFTFVHRFQRLQKSQMTKNGSLIHHSQVG